MRANFPAYFLLFAAVTLPTISSAQKPKYGPGDPAATWKEADSIDGRWNDTDVGPFLASVLASPGGTAAKGLSIKVGDRQQGAVCYDTKTMSFRAGWTGGFVKFDPRRYGIVKSPSISGKVQFHNSQLGWAKSSVEYRGLYVHGPRIVLSYRVDGAEVLEFPWLHEVASHPVFTRTFEIAAHEKSLTLSVSESLGTPFGAFADADNRTHGAHYRRGQQEAVVWIESSADSSRISFTDSGHLGLVLKPSAGVTRFTVAVCPPRGQEKPANVITPIGLDRELQKLIKPGASLWPQPLTTKGVISPPSDFPYVIDTITVPFNNPYKALMFLSGHDFFSSGDMAACTLHGDVWLISGIDERLEKNTWRRFATGLHQPLGLRIIDDKVHVLGKDQITRLHDRNGDGEADFYENFNNDGATSQGGHDYASCLETDPAGNFYYIRAGQGVCRVTKDGSLHESIATGFRNPIGLGVGPGGEVTASPQEGTWTPASFIAQIKRGGYYGFGGPKVTADRPLGYDRPLCWIPREHDGSSGGQVWVTSNRWGPLAKQMLHLSYGRCQMCLVLREAVKGVVQGGTYKFPLVFESGVMRGRFSPHDGQLYLSGLRGWQCAATKDGCIQRVRYTGKPADLPVGLNVRKDGLVLRFSRPVDRQAASDPDNFHVEQWNYRYSSNYGSKDYKVSDPNRTGRDEVEVFGVRMLDDRTVFLEVEEVRPVMQMGISYAIKAVDGVDVRQTIYNTINAVP
ncbi:MAG: DUF6797 domain-containing protein [Planctomycetota bacterium]|nr:DUF6797 domain-containing protein [Planctomycetota bacterium]